MDANAFQNAFAKLKKVPKIPKYTENTERENVGSIAADKQFHKQGNLEGWDYKLS